VRYALLPGSTISPAVALRLAYVTTTGIDDFDLDSTSFDVSVSKGFGPITPFGGIGYVKGSAALPAVALRVSHVVVSGIDDFDLDSTAFDLSVSKGFGPFTPYGGVGYTKGSADPDASFAPLKEAKVDETKLFVGARFSLGLLEFTPQFTQIGDVSSYSLRLGMSFGLN